jgi:hypothetical protein
VFAAAGPVVEQSADVCDAALRSDVLRGGEYRRVREAFLHRSNDPYRQLPDDRKLPPERRDAAWGEHLRAFLKDCDPAKSRDVAYVAEVLRELGRYDEAISTIERLWHFEDSETIWYGIAQIKKLSHEGNPYIQLITRFWEDFAKAES